MDLIQQNQFNILYQSYINELTLQGKAPKTIDMYSRYIRQLSVFCDCCPDNLSTYQIKSFLLYLVNNKSWSAVKIARNAIQFLYRHVLHYQWQWIEIVKPPKVQLLQDVLSPAEVLAIINTTKQLRYQVYYLTAYSLGLRLSEALNLTIADIDSTLMQVHIRAAKNNKDRFVPLPHATLLALRHYWATHHHPKLIFPGGKPPHIRQGQTMVMDKGGVQKTIKIVARECGIYKNVHVHTLRHSIATHMIEQGLSLCVVQVFLGHACPKTTANYVKMTEINSQKSIDMLNSLLNQFDIHWQE